VGEPACHLCKLFFDRSYPKKKKNEAGVPARESLHFKMGLLSLCSQRKKKKEGNRGRRGAPKPEDRAGTPQKNLKLASAWPRPAAQQRKKRLGEEKWLSWPTKGEKKPPSGHTGGIAHTPPFTIKSENKTHKKKNKRHGPCKLSARPVGLGWVLKRWVGAWRLENEMGGNEGRGVAGNHNPPSRKKSDRRRVTKWCSPQSPEK